MHIYITTKNISEAKSIIEKLDFTSGYAVHIEEHTSVDSFKKYINADSKDEALEELEKEIVKLKGDWCFQFTGQGCQRPGMMQSIYNNITPFRKNLDECFKIFEEIFECSLKEVIFSDDDLINQTQWTQPALFAVEYAMAMTWIGTGIMPKYVLGHSVGEYPAAVISGLMSLRTGIELIGHRGILMQSITTNGSMAAMMCDLATTKKLIEDKGIKLDIAGINSSKQTVVSGDIAEVKNIVEYAKLMKIRSRELTVSHAFHSSHMDEILERFTSIASKHRFSNPSNCKIISNVTGSMVEKAPEANYWAKHIRSAVDYVGGINSLSKLSIDNYLEVGPNPILNGMAAKIVERECNWLASANSKNELDNFYSTTGLLFESRLIDISKILD